MHPQANSQVEAINKIIKHNLKMKLDDLKGKWVDKLPRVLWTYWTTSRNATGEMPFSLTFSKEVVIPVEIGMSSLCMLSFEEHNNATKLHAELDMLKERSDNAALNIAVYQWRATYYYNARVKGRSFNIGDLVLQKITLNTREPRGDSLSSSWQGPYKVVRIIRPTTYTLEDLNGRVLKHSWHAEHLRHYYQ